MLWMKEDEWGQVIDINLIFVFRMSKVCLWGMIKVKWGCIINVSLVVGLMGNVGQVNYSVVKVGLEGFICLLVREIGLCNIIVNVVVLGFIDIDMMKEFFDV